MASRGGGPFSPTLVLPFAANIEGETQKRKRGGKKGPPFTIPRRPPPTLPHTGLRRPPRAQFRSAFSKKKSSAAGERGGKRALGEEGKRRRKLQGRSPLFARRFLAHARGKRERETEEGRGKKGTLNSRRLPERRPWDSRSLKQRNTITGNGTMGMLCTVFLCLSHLCTTIAEE